MAQAILARPDMLPPPITSHNNRPSAPRPSTATDSAATRSDYQSQRPLLPRPRTPTSTFGAIEMYNNAVYYPNWRLSEGKNPASMQISAISHVFYAFASVAPDGTVQLSMPYEDDQMPVDGHYGGIRATLALKQVNPHLKVLLSIGGGEEEATAAFIHVASDEKRRRRCAESARRLVDHYGLDGIDIDWENMIHESHCNSYLQLLYDLRAELPRPHYLLTSALSANEICLRNMALDVAFLRLDLVNVVMYDFCGNWSAAAGHASGTYAPSVTTNDNVQCRTVASALRYYTSRQGVDPRKINIGIPCFGRSWPQTVLAGDPRIQPMREQPIFAYSDLPRPGSTPGFDTNAKAAYCIGGDGGFVSYDNPDSVEHKARLVRHHGLGGLYFWDAPGDHDGHASIVMAGFYGLSPGVSSL